MAGHTFTQSLAAKFEGVKVALSQRGEWEPFRAHFQPAEAAQSAGK